MKLAAWITLIYGLIVIGGGIMGYVKAHSTSSVVMGSAFGFLLIVSGIWMMGKWMIPAYAAILLTLVLDAFFTWRWLITFKFMPAGLMSIISTVVLLILAVLVKARR
jgi:uncharacterized membrane protein (UPF0136 family)